LRCLGRQSGFGVDNEAAGFWVLPRSGCRYNTVNWIRQGEEENILEVGPRSRKVSGKPGIVGILFAHDHEVDSPGIPPPGERLIWLQASYRNIFVLFGKIRRIAAGFICSNDLKAYRVPRAVPECARGSLHPRLTPG